MKLREDFEWLIRYSHVCAGESLVAYAVYSRDSSTRLSFNLKSLTLTEMLVVSSLLFLV